GDIDGDMINNGADNCPRAFNTDQLNQDNDEWGDACDDDRDGDTIINDDDNCPNTPNPGQEDSDFDGFGDLCPDGDDSRLIALRLAQCRAENPPVLWAKACRGPTKKIGCAATPGESTGSLWWALLALVGLRRRWRSAS
ncbi:MAG: MYXO-CTERM domain-containing protein, partial [Bradymonadia bacterium]